MAWLTGYGGWSCYVHQCVLLALDGAELPCAGVYAFVERGGTIRKGDAIRIE